MSQQVFQIVHYKPLNSNAMYIDKLMVASKNFLKDVTSLSFMSHEIRCPLFEKSILSRLYNNFSSVERDDINLKLNYFDMVFFLMCRTSQ